MPRTHYVRTYQIRKGTLWGNWALPWCCFRVLLAWPSQCPNHHPFCSQVKYCGHKLHLAPWRLLPPVIGKTQVQSRKLKATEFLNLPQCRGTGLITQTGLLTRWLSLVVLGHVSSGCCWICCLGCSGKTSYITTACKASQPGEVRPFTLTRPNAERRSRYGTMPVTPVLFTWS